jgi:hypothetical protein
MPLGIVPQTREEHSLVGRLGAQTLVGVLCIQNLVAVGIFVILEPYNLSTVCTVGQFHNLSLEVVITLSGDIDAHNVVGLIIHGALRHHWHDAKQRNQ